MPVPPRPGSLKDPDVAELFEREVNLSRILRDTLADSDLNAGSR